jgi:cell division protein FtsW
MIGMMANAARHEPEAVAALRAGRDDRMTRILRLPLPEPYSPTRVEALRDRLRTKPQAAKPPRKPPPDRGARKARPPAVDKRPTRAGHHVGGQRNTGQRHARGRRALEGQRYG